MTISRCSLHNRQYVGDCWACYQSEISNKKLPTSLEIAIIALKELAESSDDLNLGSFEEYESEIRWRTNKAKKALENIKSHEKT